MTEFDPTTFMNQTMNQALDTVFLPCPPGEYMAVATKTQVLPWAKGDGSSSGLKLQINWEIQDDKAKATTGRDPLTVRQDQMLDLTDNGALNLAKGRNIGLGRIREALGLNKEGKDFSLAMLEGQVAKVVVSHRPGKDGAIFDEIKAITKV